MVRATRDNIEIVRLLKWVGDPVLVKEDGFGVPNWKYENNRLIVVPGRHNRILRKGDGAELDPNGKPIAGTGLSREYVWHKSNMSRILEVPFRDAQIILRSCGEEFKDVTDEVHPEKVTNTRIVVRSKKSAGNART